MVATRLGLCCALGVLGLPQQVAACGTGLRAESPPGNLTRCIREGLEMVQSNKKTRGALIGSLVNWKANPEQNCVGGTSGK